VGQRLAAAFDTPSGIPRASVNLATRASSNPDWAGGSSILAEAGTVQLEFFELARRSQKMVFREKV
jgi:mannosyl-oligosaccharide alpha-1,2-mannosidase